MNEQKMLKNPILPGFYPDPSICRVDKDFYLVTSSFSLFPGLPIFHSTDLAHWEQIGHVLDRKSQLHVTADSIISGIMAPTLRHHNGTFYIINTNFSDRENFIVTATDPRGPWSEPHWLTDAVGIDPSMFFDDDGKAYFTGTRRASNSNGFPAEQEIWVSEIDVEKMCLTGPRTAIWRGALRKAASPEAPHIYKKDGYYYLVIAEGGTEHFHAVTIARSRNIFDYYEGYAGNPIMTHRHLGKQYTICNVGHADFVELENREWHAVMLASRLIGGYHKNLGRETYIAPVVWEEGWPVISPGSGKVELSYPAPVLPEFKPKPIPERDDFDGDKLATQWVFIGTPYQDFFSLKDSMLTLKLLPRAMSPELRKLSFKMTPELEKADRTSQKDIEKYFPSLGFIGRRQLHENFSVTARMGFDAMSEHETAGLAVVQATNHQFRLERTWEAGKQVIRLILCTCEFKGFQFMPDFTSKTTQLELAKTEVGHRDIYLKITAVGQAHSFYYGNSTDHFIPLYENADGGLINPESVGGMVGTLLGMYASSNGFKSNNSAEFDWFEYKGWDAIGPISRLV